MAASNAERQKAFRERIRQRLAATNTQPPLPNKPKISVPATKRWIALGDQARTAIQQRRDEMQQYFDERTQAWQDSDLGAAFQERLERLENIAEALENLED